MDPLYGFRHLPGLFEGYLNQIGLLRLFKVALLLGGLLGSVFLLYLVGSFNFLLWLARHIQVDFASFDHVALHCGDGNGSFDSVVEALTVNVLVRLRTRVRGKHLLVGSIQCHRGPHGFHK